MEPIRRKKRRKKKRKHKQLPKKILIFKNRDKSWHEFWSKKRASDPLNFPHPFCCIMVGENNTGKSNNAKNIFIRQKPTFKRLVVIHDDEESKEWDDCDAEVIGGIPPKEFFDREQKTLCIIDDLDVSNLKSIQKHRLNRLVGSWRTHRNISVIICTQNFYDLPTIVRRTCNIVVLGYSKDAVSRKSIARKIDMQPSVLEALYKKYITDRHCHLWFDLTKATPYPIRLNGFEIINI